MSGDRRLWRPPRLSRSRSGDRGQATVELILGLPFVVMLLLAIVQAAVLGRDQVLVTHAAREGVRAAALDDDVGAITRAAALAGPLDPGRLKVTVEGRDGPGSRVTVRVRYPSRVFLPLIGRVITEDRQAHATMRVER